MATTYLSSSGIDQKFTSGPYSGNLVKRSFYNPSGTAFGEFINYFQGFISGSLDSLSPCLNTPIFYRLSENYILCPPGGCDIPELVTVALSSSCKATYDYKYNVAYISASIDALYTKIQYSTTSDFSSNTATSSWINNSSISIPPININNLPQIPANGSTSVYFRAFNSCSNGSTSSYSNIKSYICPTAPPSSTFNLNIFNKTLLPVLVKNNTTSTSLTVATASSAVIPLNTTIQILGFGVQGIPSKPPYPGQVLDGVNDYYQYSITASATSNYSSLIYTTITPQIDAYSSNNTYTDYEITTIPPNLQTYNSTRFITVFELHSSISTNNLTPIQFAPNTVFSSRGRGINEVLVTIDRTQWTSAGDITITINPFEPTYYLYSPEDPTCVLSGTPITLSDGSTTSVDNLRVGDRVLSPSVLTLPSSNDFNVINWAVNKLILTEDTAVVTRNISSQVNEVYSINNGALITTSTHHHIFKQNGTWVVKTTPYLMVGDYLSDKDGNEILIESIEIQTGEFTVFNLDVEENDLYIANGILTHNPLYIGPKKK